jgi:hypothetical protein
LKVKKCELCSAETRSGYYIDIYYYTGVTTPISGCDRCRELLRDAKDRLDNNKPIANVDQKICLLYLLMAATNHLRENIFVTKR